MSLSLMHLYVKTDHNLQKDFVNNQKQTRIKLGKNQNAGNKKVKRPNIEQTPQGWEIP